MDKELTEILLNFQANLSPLEDTLEKIKVMFQYEPKATLEARITSFKREVFGWNYKNKNKYSNDLLSAFINLWIRIEPNNNLKFENEQMFKIGGRLSTFAKLNKQFTQSAQLNRFKQSLGSINPLR